MSAGNAQRAEIKTMLLDMVAEAEDMKRTVGGSITDRAHPALSQLEIILNRHKSIDK